MSDGISAAARISAAVRMSAAARISAQQADVTHKKHFFFSQKRMKLACIFHQT
jgi:hypothetical protein